MSPQDLQEGVIRLFRDAGHVATIRELLDLSDDEAIGALRIQDPHISTDEAKRVIQHNDRIRGLFGQVLAVAEASGKQIPKETLYGRHACRQHEQRNP